MKVVLCDPVERFAAGLAKIVAAHGGEVGIVRSVPVNPAGGVLYIMDISLAAGFLADDQPDRPLVLAITDRADGQVLREAVAMGAAGLMSMDRPPATLLGAVNRVASGQPYYDRHLLQAALRAEPAPAPTRATGLFEQLTARERDILAGIVAGHTTRIMATRMGISIATVRSHVQKVLAKLGVHSRLEAAALVLADQPDNPPPVDTGAD